MPEVHPTQAIKTSSLIQKRLKIKLSLVLLISVFLSTITAVFIFQSTQSNLVLVVPALLTSTIGIYFIWHSLKSLETLYEQIQILTAGGVWNRSVLQTNDEIEEISNLFHHASLRLQASSDVEISAHETISAEKHKLDTIISSMVDGIIVLDLHRNIVLANKSAEKMTGYKHEELINKKMEDLISLSDSDGKKIDLKELCQVHSSIPVIVNITGKGQQKAEVKITVVQVADGIQSDLNCILILHDTTKEEVFEQMQIDFVSMASHEFRTPLTSINNYLSTLKEEAFQKLNKEQQDFLDRAFDSSKQLTALVENLLNVSKIERGSFAIIPQPLEWTRILQQAVEDNKTQAVKKDISLTLNLADRSLPPVLADQVRVTEVLNNLITNAINYTKEGGKIEVGAKVEDGVVLTYIKDNGVGIPKDILPHLFTKFFRSPTALKEMRSGTGIGLYISKSIVDLHKGKIWVESTPSKGSTFYFTLPLAESAKVNPTILQKPSNRSS